jgi:hypothetical protein
MILGEKTVGNVHPIYKIETIEHGTELMTGVKDGLPDTQPVPHAANLRGLAITGSSKRDGRSEL